jgi:hypothetical protein
MVTELEQFPDNSVEELVWAMLDGQISDEDFHRLNEILRTDEEARRVYMHCMQMHVDLQELFAAKDEKAGRRLVGLPIDLPLLSGDASLADPAFCLENKWSEFVAAATNTP